MVDEAMRHVDLTKHEARTRASAPST